VNNTSNDQVWWFTSNRQPTAFAFDPDNDIVLKQGTTTSGTVGVYVNNSELPQHFALGQNYPNPFNPVTKINFDVPAKSSVELKVYDASGKLVNTVVTGVMESGNTQLISMQPILHPVYITMSLLQRAS
jgi:hypothetical protein